MTTQTELASPQTAGRSVSPWRRAHFILPLIFVNLLALIGQSIWTKHKLSEVFLAEHTVWALGFAVLMGLTLESIGTYLSLQAHAALMANQASGGLRLAAYVIGAVMAALNFSHFSAAPTSSPSLGVMFGLASLCSPWLWGVESRAAHRAQLAGLGIVDPRGVKLSTWRKMWHPGRSLQVIRWAAWAGEVDPAKAVQGWESASRPAPQSTQTPLRAQLIVDSQTVDPAPESIQTASPQTQSIASAPALQEIADSESAAESAAESVTETVTVTETRTRTQTWSVAVEKRIQTLRTRVEAVKAAYPDWQTVPLDYGAIGSVIRRTGREVIKPIYGVLYQGQSIESALGLETVDGTVDRDRLTV